MLTLCDSIVVKLLPGNIVIAGVGNQLKVFLEADPVARILPWTLQNKIHGIEVIGSFVLIYGNREFMVLESQKSQEIKFTLSCKGKISDWISSGKLYATSGLEILLVTGHSVALKLIISDCGKPKLTSRSSCIDKSTIYCSIIVGTKLQDTTVFAGTAFGELFAWKPHFADKIHDPVLWRISCHNGVIFSIDVNLKYGLIATTSDDRSVRFYSLSWEKPSEKKLLDFKSANIIPFRSVYGHNARVFKAKIVDNDDEPFVISVGEDSFLCIWSVNGDLIFKRRHHFGATIWDFEFDKISKTLFSTSSDGNIISTTIADYFLPIQVEKQQDTLLKEEYLTKISFVKEKLIIAVTSQNRFVCYKNNNWNIIPSHSGYKCTLLVVYKDLVALTGFRIASLFKIEDKDTVVKICEKSIVPNLIRSFCFLSEDEALVCDEKGECRYSNDRFSSSVEINLPKSKEPWITSALKHDSFLLLSTRQGNLLLYKYEAKRFNLTSLIKHIHGHLGVNHMHVTDEHPNHFLVETAGHDASVKTVKIQKSTNLLSITKRRTVPVAWVEKIYKTSTNGNYVMGFNDNHFIIWCFENDVIFKISCGGGHRCWDINIDEENNRAEFIFIKNRLLHKTVTKLNVNSLNRYQIPYFSWHIKLCNTVEEFQLSSDKFLFVSGGEDNLLKLSIISLNEPEQIRLVDNSYRHISSIKSIGIVNRNSYLLIISVGGRAQICVTKFNLESTDTEECSEYMLKSNDLERKYQKNSQEVDFDPETRFMSISIVDNNTECDLYLGCSDGYLRKFIYKAGEINLVDAILYHRCILHTKAFKLNTRNYLVSAGTDGVLCFWELDKFNESLLPIFTIQHHESGVNSLDMLAKQDKILVVSGGDDQTIVYSTINVKDNIFTLEFTKFLNIHTAQVNGVRISACSQFAFTTSIDQILCIVNLETMQLKQKKSTCIADAKDLNVLTVGKTHYCVIYGWGLQILPL